MMSRPLGFLFAAIVILNGQTKVVAQTLPPVVPPPSLIREEQKVVVNGNSEIWRLEWKSPPTSSCGPEDIESAIACPCSGFAYGESGQLDLVRIVNGREIDRFKLTRLFVKEFPNEDGATLQRWEVQEKDYEESNAEGFAARVRARPTVQIMHFADYNHDGRSTEFFLQTGLEPCGKLMGIAVGVTSRNPRLHAFGTIHHPNKPLVMQKREWEALLKATGPIEVEDWPCGDHGSEIEIDLELRVTDKGIQAIRREFECTETGNRGRLLRKQTL